MKDDTILLIVIIVSLITLGVCLWIPTLKPEVKWTWPNVAIDLTEDFGTKPLKAKDYPKE